jgi:uncharacterized protein DUF1203
MSLIFSALPSEAVAQVRAGGPDANGQPAERHVSTGPRNPCRHCLREIPDGAPMLVLAWRPFPAPQPYAETGPIFLCADDCPRHPDSAAPPELFRRTPRYLIRGYGADDRIVYGTGAVVETELLEDACRAAFEDPRVAYIHLRSATNNCYQARVDRG